jgi:hypothetical protein
MNLEPILRSLGGDAYVLHDHDKGQMVVYDRRARTLSVIPDLGVLAGHGAWFEFDGDAKTIRSEVEAIRGVKDKRD